MGVIDSDDLPLNVNRQTLVQSKTFKIINQKITKKILDMIQEIAKWDDIDEEEYEEDFEYEFEEEELEKFTEDELKQKKEEARQKYLNRNK
jgi:heat shock protein beta